jgi:hypothetical protein
MQKFLGADTQVHRQQYGERIACSIFQNKEGMPKMGRLLQYWMVKSKLKSSVISTEEDKVDLPATEETRVECVCKY